jgi:hypothetical protein
MIQVRAFILLVFAILTLLSISYMIIFEAGYARSTTRSGADSEPFNVQQMNRSKFPNQRLRQHIDIKLLEQKADAYYLYLTKQRQLLKDKGIVEQFTMIDDVYPCLWGTYPIGGLSRENIEGGHKYACGIQNINSHPIVYSLGSNNDISFELAMLDLRPDSEIHVFELVKENIPLISPNKNIIFHNIGLGYKEDIMDNSNPYRNYKSLNEMMILLNHSHIDILKMDIEGAEWSFVMNEGYLLRQIGQFLVEFHTSTNGFSLKPSRYDHVSFFQWLEEIEKYGLRLFHKEWNFMNICCSELSFVQSYFQEWNENHRHA